MIRRLLLACAAAWLTSAAWCQEPIVIKFSHVVASDAPKGKSALKFKELVETRSNGRVKVEVYANSSLYKDKDELEALQLGKVQMLAPTTAKFTSIGIKELEILDLPFLFDTTQEFHRVMTTTPIGAQLMKSLEPRGLLGLALWDNGFKVMSANKALRKVADFKGLKMRIQPSKIIDGQMRALGAVPQVTALSEVYAAMQSGSVDGSENTPSNMYTLRHHEVQKFITASNHGYLGYAVITSRAFWDGLPADVRSLLETALQEATMFNNEIAEAENHQALKLMADSGKVQILQLTPEERSDWKRFMARTHRQAVDRVGKETVQAIYAATGYKAE